MMKMKLEELDRKVAEAFGWELRNHDYFKKNYEKYLVFQVRKRDWHPHKDLAQIVRYGAGWLNDRGYFVEIDSCAIDGQYVRARKFSMK